MKITFADKVDKKTVALPAKNKVVAADMNEIKASVNYIYDEDFILALDKRIIAGANRAGVGKGTTDMGGDKGVSEFCANGFEKNFQAGKVYLRDEPSQNIVSIREYYGDVPDATFDSTQKFQVGSIIEFVNGTTYECIDDAPGTALWAIITKTSKEFMFSLVFDGTTGKGEVGAINMPFFNVPEGFICTQTIANTKTPLVSAGAANVTLGYQVDMPDAIIDRLVTAFNANPIIVQNKSSFFTPTTAVRTLAGEVSVADITAGEVSFNITFSKI